MTRPRSPSSSGEETALPGARMAALYALSFHAVSLALLAWQEAAWRRGSLVAAWAALLAGAILAGERTASAVAGWFEGPGAARARVMLGLVYTALLILAPPLVAAEPRLAVREVSVFTVLQAAFVFLSATPRFALAATENALALALLASFRGGLLAASAVTGYVGLLVLFLALQHFERTIAPYPGARVPPPRIPLLQAVALAGPAVAVMAGLLVLAPSHPYAGASRRAASLPSADITAAHNAVIFMGLLGLFGLWAVRRFLPRRPSKPPVSEQLEVRPVAEEVLPPVEKSVAAAGAGPRGRIVRAYVGFLAVAARFAVKRRPEQTPREFEAALREPAGPLRLLTDLFVWARYGDGEPGETEALQAEDAAQEIAEALRGASHRRRGVRRGGASLRA